MAVTQKIFGVDVKTTGSQRTLNSASPGGASTTTTEMNTPFRDQLNINPISDETRPSKKELQQQFYQLPKPKNDFELAEVGDEDDEEGGLREEWIEDAAELEKHRQAIAEKKKAFELEKRTKAFQRQLPLPSKLNIEYKKRGAELEMLSEARARLANTQGKKAKRKAREKQLGEARRLASLQKRRELRAAGIIIGSGWAYKMKKHRLMDYNNEIPFEKQVPAGFHDPSEDKFDKAQKTMVEEKRRDWQERADRKADKDKLKKRKNEDLPESIFGEKHEKKRSKLILPEPQISDKELEDIKIGHVTDSVRELVYDNPSRTLLHDYNESARMIHFLLEHKGLLLEMLIQLLGQPMIY
uniref:Pre-mRNA splicing factor component Cdc5p/Cef1 C-terminal domain-containing protein n=1 Tax=Meloidogyne enterolobii TaxID=390850 RepID=A0A6V7VBT8_MELEN|nr:unnamed protein product [Meloidogyne enterolobii]CAD2172302.1 unnamed protein product [Meloidogyne enterolobii]